MMKDYHVGSKGDIDKGGISGWVAKRVCTGCSREFKGGFYSDAKPHQ